MKETKQKWKGKLRNDRKSLQIITWHGVNVKNVWRTHTTNNNNKIKNAQRALLSTDFSKEDTQLDNRYLKRCPTSLIINALPIKSTITSHVLEWLLSRKYLYVESNKINLQTKQKQTHWYREQTDSCQRGVGAWVKKVKGLRRKKNLATDSSMVITIEGSRGGRRR